MFTQCPHCESRFEIDITQLKLALGLVNCGRCKKEFNALETLHDEKIEGVESSAGAKMVIPQLNEKAPPLMNHDLNDELIASTETNVSELVEMNLEVDMPFNEASDSLQLFPRQEIDKQQKTSAEETPALIEGAFSLLKSSESPPKSIESNKIKYEKEKSIDELKISESLLDKLEEKDNIDEVSSRKSGMNTLGWSVAIVAMIALLAFQYIYAARDQLAGHDGLRAPLETMCSVLGCSIPLKKSVDQIQLLHKGVQGHKNAKNALVVSATYMNNASFIQPYPILELVLSDIQQEIVVKRQFYPSEYLVSKEAIEVGISPKISTQVLLEIVDPGKDAVNFEFNFL